MWGKGGGNYLDHKSQVENRIINESNLIAPSIYMQNEIKRVLLLRYILFLINLIRNGV